ncbi:MAG: hypothetical protein ACYC5G_03670 [Candidatus Doudnabacteria bacterium]
MKYITIALMAITVLLTGSIALAQEIPIHAQAQSVESAELTTEIQSQSSTTTTKPKQTTKKKKAKKKATKKQTKAKKKNAKKEVKPKKTTKKTTKKTSTKKPKKSKSISTNATSDVERANLGTTKDTLKVEQPDALGQLINSGTIDLQAQSTEDPVPRKTARKGLAVVGISGFSGLGLMLLLKKFFPH